MGVFITATGCGWTVVFLFLFFCVQMFMESCGDQMPLHCRVIESNTIDPAVLRNYEAVRLPSFSWSDQIVAWNGELFFPTDIWHKAFTLQSWRVDTMRGIHPQNILHFFLVSRSA